MNSITKKDRVGVLLGGLSSEKQISILSGDAVYRALAGLGYNVVKVEVDKNLPFRLRDLGIEVAFNALHGRFGEDGCVQGVLELMGIPYTGSGITASAAAMDKVLTKHLLTSGGILTPHYRVVRRALEYDRVLRESGINLPYIVKPACEGSSIGISTVSAPGELERAITHALEHDSRVLIEKFIEGMDVTVAVYDDRVLGSMEIRSGEKFLNYDVKYTEGRETFYIPPSLEADVIKSVEESALAAHGLLGCSFYSRMDFRVASGGRPYMLEVNTLPGLTPLSYVPKIAENKGMSYEDLVEGILRSACLKGKKEKGMPE
ncbi:MAG: D-alanine--D-alanine ligase [Deltaproteobacteria bacterium]|nr:D-alanine--D-alanine ligase [Deltaproteobacteria bacterium]MCL5277845.1 D-alanine--D-alanine ligase [Deltaproteobacteria bacterium]